jgi:hypothetical protein
MAMGYFANAEQQLEKSEGPPAARLRGPPIYATVSGLRSALAVLRHLHEIKQQAASHTV